MKTTFEVRECFVPRKSNTSCTYSYNTRFYRRVDEYCPINFSSFERLNIELNIEQTIEQSLSLSGARSNNCSTR